MLKSCSPLIARVYRWLAARAGWYDDPYQPIGECFWMLPLMVIFTNIINLHDNILINKYQGLTIYVTGSPRYTIVAATLLEFSTRNIRATWIHQVDKPRSLVSSAFRCSPLSTSPFIQHLSCLLLIYDSVSFVYGLSRVWLAFLDEISTGVELILKRFMQYLEPI